MEAANNGNIEVVRELLKRGANKKLKDNNGDTAYKLTYNKEVKKLLGGGGVFGRMFG